MVVDVVVAVAVAGHSSSCVYDHGHDQGHGHGNTPGSSVLGRAPLAFGTIAWGVAELCSARTIAGEYGNPPSVPIKK